MHFAYHLSEKKNVISHPHLVAIALAFPSMIEAESHV